MPLPMTPMRIATPIAIKTQTVAMRRERASFFESLIAMNLSRMCGMPKYPRPHAIVDKMTSGG